MPRTVIVVWAAKSADEYAILFVEDAGAYAAAAAEPGALALLSSERPFLLELDNLLMAVEGDSDLSPPQAADAQHWVIL